MKTLITVAPTGAETAKDDAPNLPVTLDELVSTAQSCEVAGAAMIHVHIRDDGGQPTLDTARLSDTVTALRENTSLIVQLSTGGSVTDSFADRLAVLDVEPRPESASLTCGTVNFGDAVFANPWGLIAELYQGMQERGIMPEFELFDIGHVATMNRLLDRFGAPPGRVHCDFVMGVPGGMPATTSTLAAGVAALPSGTSWSATGVGRRTMPMMLAALSADGHIRTGMEDVLSIEKGVPVRDNAQLIERAASLASLAQRPPMTSGDARVWLNLDER